MNKQALTFLSLFSLILVLAVYYVMLPMTDKSNIVLNPEANTEEVAGATDLLSLQSKLEKQREEIIAENNAIIASSSSSSDEKATALEVVKKTKDMNKLEKEIAEQLKSNQYPDVFVEIDKQVIKITVKKDNYSEKDANEVIRIVIDKVGTLYTPEVKFIEN